jgi:hypothetical protein
MPVHTGALRSAAADRRRDPDAVETEEDLWRLAGSDLGGTNSGESRSVVVRALGMGVLACACVRAARVFVHPPPTRSVMPVHTAALRSAAADRRRDPDAVATEEDLWRLAGSSKGGANSGESRSVDVQGSGMGVRVPASACVCACVCAACVPLTPPQNTHTHHTHKGMGTGKLSPAAVEFGIGFLKGEQQQAAEAGRTRVPNGYPSRLLDAFKQQFSAEAAELATFFTDKSFAKSFAKRVRDHAARKQPAVTSIVEILSDSDCEIVEF